MVKLTVEQQEAFVHAEPDVFSPVKGGWGEKGATSVNLRPARAQGVRTALAAAWSNVAPARMREAEARGGRKKKR